MTARENFKRILMKSGLGFCLEAFRRLRMFCYYVLDFFGWILFDTAIRCLHAKAASSAVVKKILIIRLDRVGDVVLSTPAIRAVRESYPNSRIDLLVSPYTKDLVIGNPNVDGIIIYGDKPLDRDYNVAIALHPGLTQNYLTFKSGAALRVGYSGWGGSFFLTHPLKDDRAVRVRHEVVSALEVVGKLGCTTKDLFLEVSQTQAGDNEAQDFLKKNGIGPDDRYVVIHPGSRQQYIRWFPERFAQVADRIVRECGLKVVLTGGLNEKELLMQVKGAMKSESVCASGLSLTGVVSLIKGSKLFIGNCTGPMHIAAALRIPVVAVIGAMHPLDSYEAWGPWGTSSIVVHKDSGCKSCHPGNCLTFNCMDVIASEEVFQAAVKLLK